MSTIKSGFYDYVGKKGIIIRSDVLDPDAYMPPVLIGRDEQIQDIAYLMKDIFTEGAPKNALIFGPTGCGKTATSKYALTGLMDKLVECPVGYNIDWVCISCKEVSTPTGILYKLISFLDPNTKVKRSGRSTDFYYDSLYEAMNKKNTALIVILDEIDILSRTSKDVLYSFSRSISNGKFTGKQFIRIIGISNNRDFENTLDPRILSSVGFEKFRFPAYNPDQIYQIILDRISIAFSKDSIDDEVIFECATHSAKTGGDIRKALYVLQAAAKLAELEGAEKIIVKHIKEAELKVQDDDIIKSVITLPLHYKILLLSIEKLESDNKTPNTGEVTSLYEKLCDVIGEDKSPRQTVSGWISSLEMQNYIKSTSINLGRKGGKTRLLSITPDSFKLTKKALYGDYQLEKIHNYKPLKEDINVI